MSARCEFSCLGDPAQWRAQTGSTTFFFLSTWDGQFCMGEYMRMPHKGDQRRGNDD